MIKDVELAWLAGIVDGEACIYAHWVNRGRYRTGGNVCIEMRLQVTSMVMIARVAELCEAMGVQYSPEPSRWLPKSTKPAHRISIRRQTEVVRFLRFIRPYLVVKAAEADTALAWYDKWGDQRLTPKGRASQEEKIVLFDRMRALKRTA